MPQDDTKQSESMDRDHWNSYRQAVALDRGVQAPDEMTLAAYLEGGLDERATEAVEAWLAVEPGALDRLAAIKTALDEDGGPAPERVVQRAIALVSDRGSARPAWLGLMPALWRPLAWSGAAAALLVACGMAFQLGQSAYASTLAVEHYVSQEAGLVLNEASGDLI